MKPSHHGETKRPACLATRRQLQDEFHRPFQLSFCRNARLAFARVHQWRLVLDSSAPQPWVIQQPPFLPPLLQPQDSESSLLRELGWVQLQHLVLDASVDGVALSQPAKRAGFLLRLED